MIYGVLLGGGLGTRLNGGTIPKQFLDIGDTSILLLTVEKFLLAPGFDRIVVVAPKDWVEHAINLLRHIKTPVDVCQGGRDRQESLYLALKHIEVTYGLDPEDIAVSHDVARPFVSLRILQDNIALCRQHGATDTVIPAVDTIVGSDDGQCISTMPPRKHMYYGQTPQSFHIIPFLALYESQSAEYLDSLTDAARLLLDNGVRVALVKGEAFNMKITTEHDLIFAKYLLERGNRRHA